MGMVASSRVFKVLDTDSRIDRSGEAIAPHFEGVIQFQNVHFSYLQDEPVVNGLDLSIKAGETIAIVGATGAGKSTVINLLNRFYDIDSGEISIDGKNIKSFTLTSLRGQIAIVLQDVFLFADTILNNITLRNPEISLTQVQAAAREIGIDEFIESLPGGYDFNVKERGAMLSSGQKQLLSFLRAYVTNPSILILDEATSSVDMHAEQLIQIATDKMTKNRTSIVIAHRLATVQKADRIIVMEKGKIVEDGSHHELLKNDNGYYKHLYEVQFLHTSVI